ncbi:hypothetical protein BCR35DRAFT_17028 [Leucosporidium creatinivorum]|uniref:Uncharacterized protein n=1 Tax=Leucosporidium creatinivorum TaxID=106004 RepID=A0A1Y2D3Z7_9BASI|nr:hypothetical protein BCR35DRAFT_17028 [Leucosporidium creatinivorum]
MRRILSGASSELKEYIIFCNFSPAAAEPLAQLLHDADLREVWVVRAAYKLGIITLEFLMDRVQLSPGWAVALMAYQTDNKWSSWDARRTAHR